MAKNCSISSKQQQTIADLEAERRMEERWKGRGKESEMNNTESQMDKLLLQKKAAKNK